MRSGFRRRLEHLAFYIMRRSQSVSMERTKDERRKSRTNVYALSTLFLIKERVTRLDLPRVGSFVRSFVARLVSGLTSGEGEDEEKIIPLSATLFSSQFVLLSSKEVNERLERKEPLNQTPS